MSIYKGKILNQTKLSFLIIILIIKISIACSTFLLNQGNHAIFGKNYDWDLGVGLVTVNKRHVVKTALANNNPAQWKSKYGSVTFSQYGRGFPSGGMNDAGLAIELMWLSETEYPPYDSRAEIDNMQWIQYQLDNFSTVEEVIASDSLIRIAPLSEAYIHYLVCDRMGSCASIEYIDGKRVYYANNDMPAKTLTNNIYAESIAFLKMYKGFGGILPIPKGNGSLERFVFISHIVKKYNRKKNKDIVKYGFGILSSVAMGDYTKWSILYDLTNRRVYFRTLANRKIRFIDLNKLDFSCTTPVKGIDINKKLSGNITNNLVNYTQKMNKKLINYTFSRTHFLENTPKDLREKVIHYPKSLVCE